MTIKMKIGMCADEVDCIVCEKVIPPMTNFVRVCRGSDVAPPICLVCVDLVRRIPSIRLVDSGHEAVE